MGKTYTCYCGVLFIPFHLIAVLSFPSPPAQADVELAESKVRVAEAAKDRERDSFAIVAGNEHRRRMSAALVTVSSVARGVTEEIMADVDRLEEEKGSMLVPQVSALVGCQVNCRSRCTSPTRQKVYLVWTASDKSHGKDPYWAYDQDTAAEIPQSTARVAALRSAVWNTLPSR